MKSRIVLTATFLAVMAAGVCRGSDAQPGVRRGAPETICGAVYVSANAFNAPQMWKHFDLAETRRDFGYAKEIHLNALRIWASYEYWQMEPAQFKLAFDQMLSASEANGIRVLISLFENDGVPPTPENMWTTDPAKAFGIQSPGLDIASPDHQGRWDQPREFVRWFMNNYKNDPRLLAIEVMNEPSKTTTPFAKAMLVTAKSLQGTVPLTVGTARAESAEQFISLGLNVIEFHDNFPRSREEMESRIQDALAIGHKHDLPVWLTEWQRIRPNGPGWNKATLPPIETLPDFTSLAATVREYPVGNFFWSLMIKRAYLPSQRLNGTVNGLFWPDGSVWSLADARAIAKDSTLDLTEKKSLPSDYLVYLKNMTEN